MSTEDLASYWAEFLPDMYHCIRCGFACRHVEAGGIYHCPNCGAAKDEGNDRVSYAFGHGCKICGIEGHQPKDPYMRPVPKGHPRAIFGVSPEEDTESGVGK